MQEKSQPEAPSASQLQRAGSAMGALASLEPQALIEVALTHSATVETMERLFALAKDVQAARARSAWYAAMALFQRDCPRIKKNATAKIQTTGGGSYSYTYATLDKIMGIVSPVMGGLGLSVSYRMKYDGNRVIAAARVSHEMGHHEESGEVSIPIQAGSMGANDAQRVGIASSYAKRYALLAIIGLAPENDDDDAAGPSGPQVEQPRRASEAKAQAGSSQAAGANVWIGQLASPAVTEKPGTTNGKPWLLFTVRGADGAAFGTFDTAIRDFAREAGASPVRIEYETTAKGNKNITKIEPSEGREPGDEGPNA